MPESASENKYMELHDTRRGWMNFCEALTWHQKAKSKLQLNRDWRGLPSLLKFLEWPKCQKLSVPDYLLPLPPPLSLLLLSLLYPLKTGCIGVKMNIKYRTLQILRHHIVYHTHTLAQRKRENINSFRDMETYIFMQIYLFIYLLLFCCSVHILTARVRVRACLCSKVSSFSHASPHFTHLFTSAENALASTIPHIKNI